MEVLTDKVVLITGASSGIGASTAKLFAKYGSKLAIHGRNKENLEKVAEECVQSGLARDKILLVLGDLCREENVTRIMEETLDYFKTLHILVNNAGTFLTGSIEKIPMEHYDYMMNLKVRAAVLLTQLAIPHLKANKGCVVNVSSTYGLRANVRGSVYSMVNATLNMFTSVLSLELGPAGVRVNAVNPGTVVTGLQSRMGVTDIEKYKKDRGERIPLEQRVGTPEEVAQTIVFLASDAASFITGAHLPVDGGMSQTASWFTREANALKEQK